MTVQWGLGSVLWRGTGKPGTVVAWPLGGGGGGGGASLVTGTLVRSPQLEAIRALPEPPGPWGMLGLCSSPVSCSPSGRSPPVLQALSLLPLLLPRADTRFFALEKSWEVCLRPSCSSHICTRFSWASHKLRSRSSLGFGVRRHTWHLPPPDLCVPIAAQRHPRLGSLFV